MTLEKFAARMVKAMPVDHQKVRTTPEKWYISGTVTYGGYLHKIDRAIAFRNHIGLDLICDSTDSVYGKVEGRFKTWLESTTLELRGPASVVSGAGPVENPREVVTITKHHLEKQELGGEPIGDVSGFKVKEGMVIVWNRTAPYFTLEVPGKAFSGYGKDRAWFLVDGAILQIQSTSVGDFYPKSGAQDPTIILAAHRDWEFQYLQNTVGKKAKLESWPFQLMDGTPVLYWEATPEGAENSPAKRHLYCTRCKDGVVLVTYSVETPEVSRDQAKKLLLSAIEHVTYSSRPYDMKKVQQALASSP